MKKFRRQFLLNPTFIFWTLLIIFLFVLPQFSGEYILYMVISILIFSLLCLSVNLLLGYTGLLSFGQAGFYACGAYGCGNILLVFPQILPGIIGGIVIAGVVALILGYFCVRHTAIYFAMITLAFGMMIWALAMKLRAITGADDGLGGIPRGILFNFNLKSMENYYYFVLIISLLAIFLFHRLVHSPLGLTFKGLRDSESRIACIGISIRNTRLICFTIAGMYAGLAGALVAPLETRVTPVCAHWATSAEPVAATIIGGMHTFAGPIAGAVIFFLIKDIIVRFTEYWLLILGVVVIILVLAFRARGLAGIFERVSWFKVNFEKTGNERNVTKH